MTRAWLGSIVLAAIGCTGQIVNPPPDGGAAVDGVRFDGLQPPRVDGPSGGADAPAPGTPDAPQIVADAPPGAADAPPGSPDARPPVDSAPGGDPCSGTAYTPTTPTTVGGTAPGDADSAQLQALALMDQIRHLVGLSPISLDSDLDQASQAHSSYCSTNISWCPGWHQETSGHPGYTGVNFWDRDASFGYPTTPGEYAAFEVMAPGPGPSSTIQMWMGTVYHRSPFVNPEVNQGGYGQGGYDTMDFGCCGAYDANLVTNYPVHGQTGFDRSFYGNNEGPTPPSPPAGWPSGPVISIVFPPSATVSITDHKIYDAAGCSQIAHVSGGYDLPNPGFDLSLLGPTVVLYPNAPLTSGHTYTVYVAYTMNGSPGHRTFRFTTQ